VVVIETMAAEGVLLRVSIGSLTSNALRYVATDAWLGREFAHTDPGDALVDLARRYLSGYGPARVEDLVWWSGAARIRVAAALERLDLVEHEGGLLLLTDDAEAFDSAESPPEDAVDVLPPWDPYTMGYAPDGRDRLVAGDALDRLYDRAGDGRGAVLAGGRAIATWTPAVEDFRLRVDLDPFEPLTGALSDAVEERFESCAALLDLDGCRLNVP
jgi:hypothetical protein